MNNLYIVIPAYNEEDNIQNVIDQWYPVIENCSKDGGECRLVIIDDGSKDSTYDILKKNQDDKPYMIALTKENAGHGPTITYGYKYAVENGADYVFQTDSDGQTLPEEFYQFWNKREDYNMIVGWRRTRQDGFARKIVSKVLRMVVKMRFGVKVTDANTPFRLMNAEDLGQALELVPEDFYLSNVLILAIFAKEGKKIEYIPITFKPRQGGENTINVKSIVKIGKKAFVDFKKMNETIDRMISD